ncbi:MAG: LPS export ABC transporter periplasmic protein LptC [Desulfurellaceae bacterium]|nr:LPS export ABC transporter periplasmic protein LptC [Desulfurellaceae bacterium]
MSRHQIRFMLGITVLGLILALGYLSSQVGKDPATARLIDELSTPDVTEETMVQRMTEFRRVKMQDGKKVWEIVARQARYFADTNAVVIDTPEVSLYFSDGEAVALRCQEGTVHLNGESDLLHIDLRGNLEIQMGAISLKTDQATYDRQKNTISSDGVIYVVGQGFTLEGKGYTVAVDTKQLTLKAEVYTTVTRESG